MDEITQSSMQSLVDKVKKESLSNLNRQDLLLSPSPYDTAWLALIPDLHEPTRPMFEKCMEWIVQNQTDEGFWAEDEEYNDQTDDNTGTMECLVATLACLVAVKRWRFDQDIIDKGLESVHRNAEKLLLKEKLSDVPRWFTIMFPAMLELVRDSGIQVAFRENLSRTLEELSKNRDNILAREKLDGKHQVYSPLLLFLEALPVLSYDTVVLKQILEKNLSSDGGLFQSPSATARAYITTGNTRCLAYLQCLAKSCPNGGVPSIYPVEEDLHQLVMMNQLMRSGLAEHFVPEIEQFLLQVQKNYNYKKTAPESLYGVAAELYKDSLAFWLLRINGHRVSPSIFCWFLYDEEIREHIETNYQEFAAVLLNIHRATDLMFFDELKLEEARSFAAKYLEKILANGNRKKNNYISYSLQKMIEHEIRLPWTARMDHLEHRIWIEEPASTALWLGKSSYLRLSCLHKISLQQLALKTYTLRQSIYRDELKEVKRWSKEKGLCDMEFAREKTEYCYFAFSASTSLPYNSDVRQILTKAAVIIIVADDFFDLKGSMNNLEKLTDAVRRWNVEGLSSHSKTIFEALDDLVTEVRVKCFQQNGEAIKNNLQRLWYETFHSWLMEARWGKGPTKPCVDVYLRNAMISIGAHTIVLPASCLLGVGFPVHQLWSAQEEHQDMTSLLMVTTRLLNDIQSYLKEEGEGKINYVWLYMRENEGVKIEDSIQHVQDLMNMKRRQFLQHVFTDEHCDLPKSCKQLHLSCMKVFNMFFNTSNLYDSDTELLHDIEKAFLSSPEIQKFKTHNKIPHQIPATLLPPSHQPREMVKKKTVLLPPPHPWKVFTVQKQSSGHGTRNRGGNILAGRSNMNLCFN